MSSVAKSLQGPPPVVESVAPDVVLEWVRSLLERVGRIDRLAGGFKACCPAHEDRVPSLSVKPGRVRIMLHCFAGCSEESVVAALGITVQDLFYEHYRSDPSRESGRKASSGASKPVSAGFASAGGVEDGVGRFDGLRVYQSLGFPRLGRPSATYEYVDVDGVVRFVVARFQVEGGKEFRQFSPAPGGGWFRKGPSDGVKVLYRLPQVRAGVEAGAVVVVVEGEKDADNGALLEGAVGAGERVVFTSAAGGANARWLPQYTEELAGARLVRVVADRDEPGRVHAWGVKTALDAAGIACEVVESDRGKDWSDHVMLGGSMADLVPAAPVVAPVVESSVGGSGDGDARRKRRASFVFDDGELCRVTREPLRSGRWETVLTPVLGCEARIVSVVRPSTMDDEVDDDVDGRVTHYVVEFRHRDGREPLRYTVPMKEWREAGFLESLWPDVYRPTDRTGRNHVLLGIQDLSGDADFSPTFTATGWGSVDGRAAYFHGGGAITADGLVPAKTKLVGRALADMRIEAPSATVEQLKADMADSMGLLRSGWIPRRVWAVLGGAVYRSILPKSKLVTLGVGQVGTMKTALNVLAGQHFVPTMDSLVDKAYMSMGAQGATINVIQRVQHAAKDMALVIDDAPRKKSGRDISSEATLANMITAVYDEASRDRADREGNTHIGPKPRGTVLASAEYAPTQDGARERCLVWSSPWSKDQIKMEIAVLMDQAQMVGRARARSRFLGWVIQQSAALTAAQLKDATVAAQRTYMMTLSQMDRVSQRSAEHAAKCMTGWWWVVSRLEAAGVIDAEAAQGWLDDAWAGCVEAARANADPEADVDTVAQLLRLIGQALGRGYLADASRQDSPPESMGPADCGWQPVTSSQTPVWRAAGPRLGWVRGDRLYLDPAEVFRVVQQIAADEGTLLTVFSVPTASGLLAQVIDGVRTDEGRYTHAVKIGGMNKRVWDVPLSQFWDSDPGQDHPASTKPHPLPPVPSVSGPSPVSPSCVVCGERLIPIEGSDRHPGCEDDNAPDSHSLVSENPHTGEPESQSSVSHVAGGERWRAAEVMLTGDAAVLPDGTRLALPTVSHVGDLARWAGEMRIGSGGGKGRPEPGRVWLSREWLEFHGLPVRSAKLMAEDRVREAGERVSRELAKAWQSDRFVTDAVAQGYELGRNALNGWCRVWRRGSKESAVVTSTEWVSTAALTQGDTTSEHMIRRLGLWTKAMGQPLIIQEGVSFKSMCRLNALQLPDLPWASMAADFMWQREPSETDLAMGFVHCYDRRKSYLAACASVEASDELQHVTDPPVDPKRPGFWHVTRCDWADQGFVLPDPRLDYDGDICDWVATPTLALLMEYAHVEVDEAWLYVGKTSRVCETAYETTRRALDMAEAWRLDDDVAAVIAGLKASYRLGIGQMAMTRDVAAGTSKRGYRPDVRASIIATHRANSLRAMLWAGSGGRWPLAMARADSVLFASDDPDPVSGWPGREDGMSARLGKYKAAGTQIMSEWVRLALSDPVSPSRSIWAVTDPDKAEVEHEVGGSVYTSGGEQWIVDDDGRPTRVT